MKGLSPALRFLLDFAHTVHLPRQMDQMPLMDQIQTPIDDALSQKFVPGFLDGLTRRIFQMWQYDQSTYDGFNDSPY